MCVCEQKQAQAHIGTPKAKGTHIKQSPQTTSRTKGKVKRELKTDAKINPSTNRIKKTLFLGFVLLPFQLFHSDVWLLNGFSLLHTHLLKGVAFVRILAGFARGFACGERWWERFPIFTSELEMENYQNPHQAAPNAARFFCCSECVAVSSI